MNWEEGFAQKAAAHPAKAVGGEGFPGQIPDDEVETFAAKYNTTTDPKRWMPWSRTST